MALKQAGVSREFAAHHPEAGEIKKNSTLTGEQAMALGDIFASKITSISRKPELTQRDAIFIDKVADLGSRSIVFCLENRLLAAPKDEQLVNGFLAKAHSAPRLRPSGESQPTYYPEDKIVAELSGLTGGNASVLSSPNLREQAEDFAAAVMPFIGTMIYENEGGLHVNEYLAGNLQNLLVQHELHDAQILTL